MAFQAWDVMMQAHPIAGMESANLRANPDDSPGSFVPKNSRRRNGAEVDFLYICRTNATRGDAHKQFGRSNPRHLHFLEAQVINPAVNHRAHLFGNFIHAKMPP